MKQIVFLLIAALAISSFPLPSYALEPDEIASSYAVLMDAQTGQALYDKRMNARAYPASITKIMTGLLAMESGLPEDTVLTVSEAAVDIPRSSTSIGLVEEEEITVGDAMYAMMLPSANDAANVLAEGVSGSLPAFAALMNERAKGLGAVNTSFVNASGLPRRNRHYTTAYDMALITRAAIQNERFMTYFGEDAHTIPATNLHDTARSLKNGQYMLRADTGYYNAEVIGGKVGYTRQSRHTMSTVAVRDGRTLICVVMDCTAEEKYADTEKLLDYGFTSFEPAVVTDEAGLLHRPLVEDGAEAGAVSFVTGGSWHLLLPAGMDAEDVEVRYNLPETITDAENITASVSLHPVGLAGNGIPSAFLKEPLEYQLTVYPPAVEAAAGAPDIPVTKRAEEASFLKTSVFSWPIAMCIAAFLVLAMVLFRIHGGKRRNGMRRR